MSPLMTAEQMNALCDWLAGPAACNIHADPNSMDDPDGLLWNCDGALDLTTDWLCKQGLDVEANLEAIRRLGGQCDCKVVFNVRDRWPPR